MIPDGKVANTTSKASEPVAKEAEKGKQSKKAEKTSKAQKASKDTNVATSKMYAMNSIYDETVRIDPSKVSKMYPMQNVYGDQIFAQEIAAGESKQNGAPKAKSEVKKPKPEKQQPKVEEGNF